jgi:glycosyltransferase involved in cell wall biosynthesis
MGNSGWAWHLFAAPAVWIGRLRGIPVIVNYRGGEAGAFLERQSAWVKPTLRQAAAIVVPSGFLEEVFARFDIATEVVPNIIDLSRFHPPSSVPAGHHIAVTRNLEDIYDIPTALRAFAEIRRMYPDATLTVAGSGPKLGELQDLARALGVASATCFTGRLDNDKMADLYRRTNLVLNSSTVDNMPVSLLEAMASGVPIVSTNVGGIPHLVEDGKNALLVPPRHPEAMAAAALRIFADDVFATSLRSAAIDAVSRYTWLQVRPQLFGVYSRALRGRIAGSVRNLI